eukprot:scaffold79954_cov22-Tisochrysis_lutea.AAC.4
MARAGTCLGGCASEAGNGGPLRVYEWPTVALPCVCTTQVIGTGVNAINHGEIKSVGELQAAAFGPTGKVPFADVKGNEGRIQNWHWGFHRHPPQSYHYNLSVSLSPTFSVAMCVAAMLMLSADVHCKRRVAFLPLSLIDVKTGGRNYEHAQIGTLLSREAVPAFMHDQACPSGEAALEFIEKAPSLPDMVLLDVTLPGMSGFEVRRSSP